MNAETKTVEDALREASALMTIDQIREATDLEDSVVRAELRQLAKRGQIEHVPGRGRYEGRYALLATKEPASGDSEGGEADVRAIPAPEYDPNSVAFDSGAHPDSDAALAARISKLSGDIHPDASGMNVGTFQVADLLVLVQDERCAAAMSLLNVIADIHVAVGDNTGKIMLGELAGHIGTIYRLGEAHKTACMDWERSMMAAIGEDGTGSVVEAIENLKAERDASRRVNAEMQAELANARALADKLEHLLGSERTATAALREQLDSVTSPEVRGFTFAGYIMTAAKRSPRRYAKSEKAIAAAKGAIRSGAQRAEVFALFPIGVAKPGAVWLSK